MHTPPSAFFHRFHSFLSRRFLSQSTAIAAGDTTTAVPFRQQRKRRTIADPFVLNPAKQALTEYLYSTRALFYPHAENISKHSPSFLQSLLSNLKLSRSRAFPDVQQFLRYNPINEYLPFLESIGIAASDVSRFLPADRLFLCDNPQLLNSISALSNYGFPWTKLGLLYSHDASIFDSDGSLLRRRLDAIIELGFSRTQLVGICLAFPFVLGRREEESTGEDDGLFDDLKWVLLKSHLADSRCLDLCYVNCRKVGIFYDLGCEKGTIGEALGDGLNILLESSEENVKEKVSFFSRLGMKNEDVGRLIVRRPEILNFNLKDLVITMPEFLSYIGLDRKSKREIVLGYRHVLGRNTIGNLPEIMKAIGLHGWFSSKILNGGHRLLTGFNAKSDKEESKSNPRSDRTAEDKLLIPKMEFLLGVGFGENDIAREIVLKLHATKEQLDQRFSCLIGMGIEHSELVKMMLLSPKILNQSVAMIEEKIDFFQNGLKLSLQDLQKFPGCLLFDLEKRVKPRHRIMAWLRERDLLVINYAPATILATSERRFISCLKRIHPAAPKQWLESFSFRDYNGFN
ncbi:transcription termination factor MTEF18, mitochondrial isoform X1 [Nymphaea colorata]|uniref:Transcription termination factor MTEF18, mitochondrial n=1 Tax=Nymphaea colorata TaxID=210225 RepID=A0A5K0YMP8_9MAGN|nr:transcription termination factor MTEF18, mitochondrial isoform X1 [Nymphaea colorata]VVV77873.1 unnamed protein product [Nymphaea colorata]